MSVSTRNRVYDGISTLLQQQYNCGENTERCLIWCLALVRGSASAGVGRSWQNGNNQSFPSSSSKQNSLLSEIAGHTKRDLLESLEMVAQEPSKRGLLASILRSQILKNNAAITL